MNKYIIGIYDDRKAISNKRLGNKYKELTEFFIKHMKATNSNYLVAENINALLDKATAANYEYCLIMSIGHFIQTPIFFKYIETWIEKTDFFITGHIIDKETNNSQKNSDGHYWGLHKQCLLVNLKYYKQFGNPDWGSGLEDTEVTVARAKRSSIDIHDDYTPIYLSPSNESQVCTPYVNGWNFINKSLENGLKVYNFHPKIRVTKKYCYPTKNMNELQEQLDWINNILATAQDCVFFWNTEGYYDIINNKLPKVKKLYSVAAAFKPNAILNTYDFYDDSEIIYFDYSKQALAFKKLLIQEWDGKDYPGFLRQAVVKYKINETVGGRTEGKTYEELLKMELVYWKSEDNLYSHWQRYKKLKHTFIYCDILENPNNILDKIDNTNDSIIWWSNVFHTVKAHYTKTEEELKEYYNTWVTSIYNKNKDIIVYGTDWSNNKISGISIEKYKNDL